MKSLLALASIFLAVRAASAADAAPPVKKTAAAAKKSAPKASDPFTEQLKKALAKDPDLVLDVLKAKKKELYDLVMQENRDEQEAEAKRQAQAEQKAFEDSFKHPYQPVIDEKTRIRGNKDAKYTLVEYSDFQCPYCGRGFQTVEALRKKYGDSLRFVFKNLPLTSIHPQAMPTAQYFEAVALQSTEKSWEFHDKMFTNQQQLSDDFRKESAKALGLDVDKADADAKSDPVKKRIEADMDEARNFGFTGTPGFLLNGIPVRGAYPVEKFDEIIKKLDERKN